MNNKIRENQQNHISKLLNPNWKLAQQHGLASKIGVAQDNDLIFCKCCFHHINKKPIPLSEHVKQLQFLGFGIPLYFSFVKYCIFLLLVTICSYSIPSLYYAINHNQQFCKTNLDNVKKKEKLIHFRKYENDFLVQKSVSGQISEQEAAHEIECTGWMIHVSRIETKVTAEEELFRFSSFAIHLILLIYVRNRLTKLKSYFDERRTTPSDFAVFIKNIPPSKGQRNLIERFIKAHYGPLSIRQIILIPNLKQLHQMESQGVSLIAQLQHTAKKYKQRNENVVDIEKKLQENESLMRKEILKKKKLYFDDELESERALLIFNTEKQKQQLLQKFTQVSIQQVDWKSVQMSQASEPLQIIWQNASYKSLDKKCFKFIGWLLSLLVLFLVTGLFMLLSHLKQKIVEEKILEYKKNHEQKNLLHQAFELVIGMIFLVVLFNKFIMSHLFHKFTEIERHSNQYKFQFYFCLKYCLGLFFTTALMTLIIQDFFFNNFFRHNFGVVQEQTIMFLFNSTFVPLFWLINPSLLIKKLKRYLYYGSLYFTQKDANQIMQDPPYDVGKRYGQVIEIMWFTFLYITIIPIGAVFSLFGLVCYYWIDKYNLLRRSSVKALVSGELIEMTLNLFDVTLLLRVGGEILFDYQIRDGVKQIEWIYLLISISYIFLPVHAIGIINSQRFQPQQKSYEAAEKLFKNTYINCHTLFNTLQQDRQNIQNEKQEKKMNEKKARVKLQMEKIQNRFDQQIEDD